MNDKEKKLSEALNEYFGKDLGDVVYASAESISFNPTKLPAPESNILITTVPHKPTFEEKRKELVYQLEKDLKDIDDNFNVVEGIGTPDVTYIRYSNFPYCELYLNGNVNFYGSYGSAKQMVKAMETISGFSWKLKRLKEQYKDETI